MGEGPRVRAAKIEAGLEHSRVLVLCMSAHAFGSDPGAPGFADRFSPSDGVCPFAFTTILVESR